MKTKFLALCAMLLLGATTIFAQKITYSPSVIKPGSPLTITVDLDQCTGADVPPLLGATQDLYLWTWTEGGPASPHNGSTFSNSDEFNKMTRVGTTGNIYTYTYSPTLVDYFTATKSELWGKTLGCLVKAKDGTHKQTEDLKTTIPAPVVGPQLQVTHPVKWYKDSLLVDAQDVITFKYNNSLDTATYKGVAIDEMYFSMRLYFDDGSKIYTSNFADLDTNPLLKMTPMPNSEYWYSFLLDEFLKDPAVCANSAAIQAKLATTKITQVLMKPYKRRSTPGTGPFFTAPSVNLPDYFVTPRR
jgi:hypothetical protein